MILSFQGSELSKDRNVLSASNTLLLNQQNVSPVFAGGSVIVNGEIVTVRLGGVWSDGSNGEGEATLDIVVADFVDNLSILNSRVLDDFSAISIVSYSALGGSNVVIDTEYEIILSNATAPFADSVTDISQITSEIVTTYNSSAVGGGKQSIREEIAVALDGPNYGVIYSYKWNNKLSNPGFNNTYTSRSNYQLRNDIITIS